METPPGFKHGERGVYVPQNRALATKYLDGSEQLIAKVIANASDLAVGSEELDRGAYDFASQYHLSPERVNLLRPLKYLLRGRVLEIGSGCGAITRFLGENAAQVTAVESTFERAAICRSRCRDLTNVQVLAGELSDLDGDQQFDTVVVVGVLEYSQAFMGGPDGPAAFLNLCRKLVRRDGHLILAIENKLGLKYLAGAPEDHLNKPYAGIDGNYNCVGPITYGPLELRQLLRSTGWSRQEFLFPFPDYKFPAVITGSEMLADDPALATSIIRFTPGLENSDANYRSFSEEMAWAGAIQNGLGAALANSFLVVSTSGHGQFVRCPFHIFSTRRKRCFSKFTLIDPLAFSEAQRARLYPEATCSTGIVRQVIESEPILRGRLYIEEFCQILNKPGWTPEALKKAAGPWMDLLRASAISADEDPLLPGDFLDCVPANMIADDLNRFDQEWISQEPVRMSRVLTRGFVDALMRLRSVAEPGPGVPVNVYQLLLACGIDESSMRSALDAESELQQFVTGRSNPAEWYRQAALRCVRRPELIREFGAAIPSENNGSTEAVCAALGGANQRASALQYELDLIHASGTYRVSKVFSNVLKRIRG